MKLQVEVLWELIDKLDSHETRLAQHQKHAAELDECLKSVETLVELRHVPTPLPPPAEPSAQQSACERPSRSRAERLLQIECGGARAAAPRDARASACPPRVVRRDRCTQCVLH